MWDKLHEKYPDNRLFTLMSNKKFQSLVYLIIWCIIIFIICVVYIKPASDYLNNLVDNETNTVSNTIETDSVPFEEMKHTLLEKNYAYVYKFNNEVTYKGENLGNQSSGYKESSDGIRRYYLDGDHEYDVSFGVYTEIDYEEVFKTYFNVDYIFSLMENQVVLVLDNIVSYKNDDIKVTIIKNDQNIERIEIVKDEDLYRLEFSKIGQIKEISK